MPEMDGIEATKRIRALPDADKRGVPIIAMSAHVFSSEIDDPCDKKSAASPAFYGML